MQSFSSAHPLRPVCLALASAASFVAFAPLAPLAQAQELGAPAEVGSSKRQAVPVPANAASAPVQAPKGAKPAPASKAVTSSAAAQSTTSSSQPESNALAKVQQVEVKAARDNDIEQRRRATAAKIIVGRDEIEKYGDDSIGEVLKRLPGVTVQGQGGRGGQIRMRGLGNGYTQILLDGERVQGGLSLDSLTPDMVERIEIIRAPTAETGARAIGGTINIITREGFVKKLNDLRVTVGREGDGGGAYASWTRTGQSENFDFSLTGSAFEGTQPNFSEVLIESETQGLRHQTSQGQGWRRGMDMNMRLNWRLDGGGSLMLMPMVFHHRSTARSTSFQQAIDPPGAALDWETAQSRTQTDTTMVRMNGLWRMPVGPGRLEVRGGTGGSDTRSHTLRDEDGVSEVYDDKVHSRERSLSLNAKYSLLMENGHSLVTGIEADIAQRVERRDALVLGVPSSGDFGENLEATSRRLALYAQDEWQFNPNWSAYAGLRWEGIRTQGADTGAGVPKNLSSVWTPLLHAMWKPDPKGRDQFRASLTRSYRSPTLSDLVGATWLAKGTNSPTNPDRSGNALLKPELAAGIDLAYEHYPEDGGVFSISLFQRRIDNLMRTLTTQEMTASGLRWVARPTNIGKALTQGVEVEWRGRLEQWWEDAPKVDVRFNASLFHSKVETLEGPDNRLDQQPDGTLNFGADYKLPGTAFTLGGSLNWTPAYVTRLSDTQWIHRSMKRVADAFVMYQLRPDVRLRLSASNLGAQDNQTLSELRWPGASESRWSQSQGFTAWRLQMEWKM